MLILRQIIDQDESPIDHGTNGSATYRGGESPWYIQKAPITLELDYFPSGWRYRRNGKEEPVDWRIVHNLLDTYPGLTPAGIWLEEKLKGWNDSYLSSSLEILQLKNEFEFKFFTLLYK